MFALGANLTPQAGPLRNREPASVTWANRVDETLHVVAGTALDHWNLRPTAIPAGSRGRIQIHNTDSTKIAEAGAPGTAVRMLVATWAPDAQESPLPLAKTEITAGVEFLARAGFNAMRVHGLEYWLCAGATTDYSFPADRLDAFDWFLAECKRCGLYWIFNPRQPELYQAGPSRFSMPGSAKDYKQRLFVQQDARDHWRRGFDLLYNRVNKYTRTNMLQDPALYLIEPINECSAAQTSHVAWPAVWTTRDYPRGTGALTWNEWLDDPAQAHGYNGADSTARLAQINASWATLPGVPYASITAIPAPSGTELPNLSIAATQRAIDVVLYIGYLDAALASFFAAEMAFFGYVGLYSPLIAFPNAMAIDAAAASASNSVVNFHNYTFLAQTPAPAAVLSSGAANAPVWDWQSWLYTVSMFTSGKPSYAGEYGWPYWGKYRNQYGMLAAFAAMQGGCGVSLFYQGDFFSKTYDTNAKGRVRALYPLAGHTDPVMRFTEALMFFAFGLGYVTEATVTKTLIINRQYYGLSPRATGRIFRAFFNLFLPTMLYGGLTKTRLNWTSNPSDDSLASTEGTKTWTGICAEALAGTGFSGVAITAGNAAYVDSQANVGTITAVATTGVIGTVTATLTQPVLTLAPSNTLVDGDVIQIPSLTGTPGTWPGINLRGTQCVVKFTGVANRFQITSGLDLTAALSGANFTAGTWNGFANEMQSGTGELFVSRRRKFVAIDAPKLKSIVMGIGGTAPSLTGLTAVTIGDLCGFFVASLDGQPIATSTKLRIGMCGNARNTGDTFSASDTTMDTVGTYPIQIEDDTVTFTLTIANAASLKLYRLQSDGQRSSRETPVSVNVTAGTITITLRTGSIYPSCDWELTQ